jgi:hypothetical protein
MEGAELRVGNYGETWPEIGTENLSNTNLELYRYASQFASNVTRDQQSDDDDYYYY